MSRWLAIGAAALLATWTPDADACGNVTHAWITMDALAQLEDGEMKSLLSRPELEQMLRNGTLFPDGGERYLSEDHVWQEGV